MKTKTYFSAGILGLSLLSNSVNAAIIVSDDFANSTSSGTGWTSNWDTDKGSQTNLTYPGHPTSGNAAGAANGNAFRLLSAQTTGTIYVSALIVSGGYKVVNPWDGLANFGLYNDNDEKFNFGASWDGDSVGDFYGSWVNNGGSSINSNISIVNNATALFIGRVNLDTNVADFWVNPDLSLALGVPSFTATTPGDFDFNRIRVESTASSIVDELRIGTQLSDVTSAVPEPSSALLAGLASLLTLRRRRR